MAIGRDHGEFQAHHREDFAHYGLVVEVIVPHGPEPLAEGVVRCGRRGNLQRACRLVALQRRQQGGLELGVLYLRDELADRPGPAVPDDPVELQHGLSRQLDTVRPLDVAPDQAQRRNRPDRVQLGDQV
ncbi:hypothetical protein, partial [Streptomyces flaveolus]|uniref:hypothetical protein n=1 Tax=Streptomyces flaveolus TaxID=67297 RepID=UPI0036FE65A0